MNNNSLVSVIIPTFHGEKYLEEALLSVFNQTCNNYEVIVVDDGSVTDKAAKICDKYKDKLKYIRQENKGLSAARNAGIRSSNGEYVAFLDDDDLWLPEKLEKQVRYYEELKAQDINAGLIYTGYYYMLESGEVVCKTMCRSCGKHYKNLLSVNFIGPPSSVFVARSILDESGLFDESMKGAQDWDLWLRIARERPIYSLNEYLIKYRSRPDSLYKNAPLMTDDLKYLCAKIVSAESKNGLLDDREIRSLTDCYQSEIARLWKVAAYDHLFAKGDKETFRDYIRKGYQSDRSLFGFRVLTFYLLSFVSVSLCQMIRKLKKQSLGKSFPSIIRDARDLKF